MSLFFFGFNIINLKLIKLVILLSIFYKAFMIDLDIMPPDWKFA